MKIALLTYHYSCNNGAVMQTYSLCRYLKELGHEVQLVDIRQDESEYQPFYVKAIKAVIFGYRIHRVIRKYYPKLTRHYGSLQELQNDPPEADCYIVGSDQVWNPDISKELMLAYFLDFGKISTKRISYASSFGISEWIIKNNNINDKIKELLNRFAALSVREEQGKQLCEREFGFIPNVVLDPTFLNYSYDEFCKGVKTTQEVICYKLNMTKDFWENIGSVGKMLGMRLTLLNYNYPKKGFHYCFPPSLETWMRKLAGASFIVTDSFHGIAFSIINRKQFVTILNEDGKNSRLINIMHEMGLDNRVFNCVADMKNNLSWLDPINYENLESLISKNIEKSSKYLINALQG